MSPTTEEQQKRQALLLLTSYYGSDDDDDDDDDDKGEERDREREERKHDKHNAEESMASEVGEGGKALQEPTAEPADDDVRRPPGDDPLNPCSNLFGSLPPPRNCPSGTLASSPSPPWEQAEGLSSGLVPPAAVTAPTLLTRKRKAKRPVKLVVPTLTPGADDDDEVERDSADIERNKRLRALAAGARGRSALFAILPKPVNPSRITDLTAEVSNFLPGSVRAKQKGAVSSAPAEKKVNMPLEVAAPKETSIWEDAAVSNPTDDAAVKDLEAAAESDLAHLPSQPASEVSSSSSSFVNHFRSAPHVPGDANETSGFEAQVAASMAYPPEHYQQYPNPEGLYPGFPPEPCQYYYSDPSQGYAGYPEPQYGEQYNQHYAAGAHVQSVQTIDASEITQVAGMRRGEKGPVQIQDVNVAQVMGSYNPIKDASLQSTKKAGYGHLKPTRMQKSKHNIMALAFQAKEMEDKLQQSWAQSRVTKRQTQSKYGF